MKAIYPNYQRESTGVGVNLQVNLIGEYLLLYLGNKSPSVRTVMPDHFSCVVLGLADNICEPCGQVTWTLKGLLPTYQIRQSRDLSLSNYVSVYDS